MDDSAELFLFDEEDDTATETLEPAPWKVLIVDDDSEMHTVTKLVLNNFSYQDRKLSFIDAYNAAEAYQLLSEHGDVAIALVDVVMESDDAGLLLIDDIRQRLNNHKIRLILRTGQPGLAPIREVIRRYDVSDYKNKTELSDVNLDTLMCASLRAYQEITELHSQRNNLRAVINSSSHIENCKNEQNLAIGVFHELIDLLTQQDAKLTLSGLALSVYRSKLKVLHSEGKLAYLEEVRNLHELPSRVQSLLNQAQQNQQHSFGENNAVFYLQNTDSEPLMFYLEGWSDTQQLQLEPLNYLIQTTAVRLENQHLQKQLAHGQLRLVELIHQAIQTKQYNTEQLSNIERYCAKLAAAYSLSDQQCEALNQAASFYDLANHGLPDVLLSCNMLSQGSWQRIAEHCELPDALKDPAVQQQIDAALIVANQSQEHWDGSGRPLGLSGEAIHVYARIVALAVFLSEQTDQQASLAQLDLANNPHFDPQLTTFTVKHMLNPD
ncbi:DUF3369 domain-containing protein [Agarivorans sp. B2Z047]|uniref:DUF3369 domain-containing protein n=1 Tax=Agarivorans sp. B2Z047 TaxID=2652721 RepID=UPI00128B3374|nr:DUF3369 domain-containing protein [Agarivorans sp. B2Z047]MPW27621.1 DUF3369 domain-containing protein [Agarivorans sp. B2Z047]UQN44539.1 DUF3369 domain-containing protein [Agarivorans sp. B2Z047]